MQENQVKWLKTLTSVEKMYRKIEAPPTPIEKFELPFEGKLAEDNRWVMMANLIPWSEFEDEYAQQFTIEMGPPAKSFRTAIGALIIKERLGLSDRETVEQIRENPDLQYFIGLNKYSNAPFEASMLVHFRQRLDSGLVNRMNQSIVKNSREEESEEVNEKK